MFGSLPSTLNQSSKIPRRYERVAEENAWVAVVESEPTKDSTDAVCTVAASKLLDIVTVLGRERDVEVVLVSRDMIFHQV